MQFISMTDADPEGRFSFKEEVRNLFHHLGQALGDAFLPYKFVLVGKRLDLGPIDEQGIGGEFTVVTQIAVHLYQDVFGTGCQMEGTEPGNGGVVRGFLSVQQELAINPVLAEIFNGTGAAHPVHRSKDNNFQHLAWVHFISLQMRVSAKQFA